MSLVPRKWFQMVLAMFWLVFTSFLIKCLNNNHVDSYEIQNRYLCPADPLTSRSNFQCWLVIWFLPYDQITAKWIALWALLCIHASVIYNWLTFARLLGVWRQSQRTVVRHIRDRLPGHHIDTTNATHIHNDGQFSVGGYQSAQREPMQTWREEHANASQKAHRRWGSRCEGTEMITALLCRPLCFVCSAN